MEKLVPPGQFLRIVEQRPIMRDHPFKDFDLGLCGVHSGQSGRGSFQNFPERIKLGDLAVVEFRNDGAMVSQVRHQALRFETLQRLSNRSSADTESKRQIGFAQSAARG